MQRGIARQNFEKIGIWACTDAGDENWDIEKWSKLLKELVLKKTNKRERERKRKGPRKEEGKS